MYIDNFNSNIDNLRGHGVIDPNIVSGADLDARGYYAFVPDTAIIKLEEEKAVLGQKMAATKANYDALIKRSGNAMAYLQSSESKVSILKAQIAGTYGRSSYDSAQIAAFSHELAGIQAEQKVQGEIWQTSNEQASATQYEMRNIGMEIQKIDSEIAVLNKHAGTDPVTVGDPKDAEIYNEGKGNSSDPDPVYDVPVSQPVVESGLISQIGAKFGLSKNQTYMAFGAIGILGIVLITKK